MLSRHDGHGALISTNKEPLLPGLFRLHDIGARGHQWVCKAHSYRSRHLGTIGTGVHDIEYGPGCGHGAKLVDRAKPKITFLTRHKFITFCFELEMGVSRYVLVSPSLSDRTKVTPPSVSFVTQCRNHIFHHRAKTFV